MDKGSEYDLKNPPNASQSLSLPQHCVNSSEVIWIFPEWNSKTQVQHLAKLTNCEM